MKIEARLDALGLALPAPLVLPPGVSLPVPWVRVRGARAFLSGHNPLEPDGTLGRSRGQVGVELSVEDGYAAARSACLFALASLRRALGDLDRVTAWLVVSGFVNAPSGSTATTRVMNGFSDLVLELYGPDAGAHARTAVGVSALPQNLPVIVSGEVEIAPA